MKLLHSFVGAAGLLLSMPGYSALFSTVDRVNLVHEHSTDISQAVSPPGFVVTPQEVREVALGTKYAWNLYADREFYYLSSAIQKFSSSSGDNSWLARENGIRVRGTDRGDLEKLQALKRRAPHMTRTPSALKEALGQTGQR